MGKNWALLDKSMAAQAYRQIHYQGVISKACRGLSRNYNAESGFVCKPLWARPEAHICGVALLAKDYGHCLQSAPSSCTLQALLSNHRLVQKRPENFLMTIVFGGLILLMMVLTVLNWFI